MQHLGVEDVRVGLPEQIAIGLDWSEVEATPVHHANQVLAHLGPPSAGGIPDGIYVAWGSVAPPVIPADEAGRAARVAELAESQLKVTVDGRIQVSRETLKDALRVLQTALDQYDAAVEKAAQREREGK